MPAFYEIMISARDEASGTFQKVAQEAKRAKAEVDKSGLDSLKEQFGARSALKDYSEILVGGGAVVGLSFAANAFADLGTGIRDLNREFDAGKITVEQYWLKFAEGIPILGDLVKGTDALADTIIESTQAAEDHRKKQQEILEIERHRLANREREKGIKGIREDLEDFDRGAVSKETEAERRRAQHAAEMKRLDDLEKENLKFDPTGGGAFGEIQNRRFAADARLEEDLAEIAKKEAEALPGKIDARLDKFFGPVDSEGLLTTTDELRAMAEKEAKELEGKIDSRLDAIFGTVEGEVGDGGFKKARDRVDDALENFFGEMEEDAETFGFEAATEKTKKRETARFAKGEESRGTGIGALARAGADPALDIARDTNREQKKGNDLLNTGFANLADLFGKFLEQIGYDGANA